MAKEKVTLLNACTCVRNIREEYRANFSVYRGKLSAASETCIFIIRIFIIRIVYSDEDLLIEISIKVINFRTFNFKCRGKVISYQFKTI